MYKLTRMVDSAWIGLGTIATAAVLGVFLVLAGCQTMPTDVRQQHLQACEAYTSALERVVLWRFKFTDEQWVQVQEVEAATTPVCMTAEPSVSGVQVVNTALASLEALLASIAIEEAS